MPLLPYPLSPAQPAPATGDITTWNGGLIMPNLPRASYVLAPPPLPSGTPHAILVTNFSDYNQEYYANSLGDIPVSAAYEYPIHDGVAIIQAFLSDLYYQIPDDSVYSDFLHMPTPSGWQIFNHPAMRGTVTREVEEVIYSDVRKIVRYHETWQVYSHEAMGVHLGLTNMIGLGILTAMMFCSAPAVGRRPRKGT